MVVHSVFSFVCQFANCHSLQHMTMPSKAKNVQLFDLHHSTLGQFLKELLGSIPGYHASQVLLARYMPGGLQFQSLGFSSQAEMTNFKRESKLQLDDAFRPVQTLSAVSQPLQVCWSKPMAWITHATATGLQPDGFLHLFWHPKGPKLFDFFSILDIANLRHYPLARVRFDPLNGLPPL